MRYIDADKLAKTYMLKGKDKLRLATVINELELAPTADVVEVIRCKDCSCAESLPSGLLRCRLHSVHSMFGNSIFNVKPDDYCSYGERKEECKPKK